LQFSLLSLSLSVTRYFVVSNSKNLDSCTSPQSVTPSHSFLLMLPFCIHCTHNTVSNSTSSLNGQLWFLSLPLSMFLSLSLWHMYVYIYECESSKECDMSHQILLMSCSLVKNQSTN
jgi:hypothetical protein